MREELISNADGVTDMSNEATIYIGTPEALQAEIGLLPCYTGPFIVAAFNAAGEQITPESGIDSVFRHVGFGPMADKTQKRRPAEVSPKPINADHAAAATSSPESFQSA